MIGVVPEIPVWLPDDNGLLRHVENYYYFSWSGDKYISPLIEKFYDEHLGITHETDIAQMFYATHNMKLTKLWNDYAVEYEAKNPYDVHEELDYLHSGQNEVTNSGNDTNVRTGNIEESGTVQDTRQVYPYDGNNPKNESVITSVKGGSVGVDKPKTTFNNVTDSFTHGKKSTGIDAAVDDLDTHKYGNLGILPMARILGEDIELWKMDFYTTILFPMLDRFLTLPIY